MSTSVAGVTTNFFPDAENGFTTTTAGSVASGATTVTLNSVAGYTNGEPVVLVIDPTDVTKKQTFTGIMDTAGVQVTSVVWTAGTNQTHALGATVVDYATATHIAMMSKGIKVSLDQDGTLKAGAVDNAAALASNVVTTAKILNANVTPDKLATGAATAYVATSESLNTTGYSDITTTTDTVTVTVGANGLANVSINSNMLNTTVHTLAYTSFAISGATTLAASDKYCIYFQAYANNASGKYGATWLMTGLTPGSTTFKMKYKASGNFSSWSDRFISVVPL